MSSAWHDKPRSRTLNWIEAMLLGVVGLEFVGIGWLFVHYS